MPPTPACPRCGYDLSGQVAAWGGRVLRSEEEPRRHEEHEDEAVEVAEGAACPVTGTCSECGLEFEWRLVMRPELAGLTWFVETAQWRTTRACFITSLRALMAWSFWQYVRLETPLSLPRVARWGATMAAAMLVMLALPTIAGAYTLNLFATRRYVPIGPAYPTSPGLLNITPAPMGWSAPDFSHFDPLEVATTIQNNLRQTWLGDGYTWRHGPDGLIWLIGATLMPPVVLLALPHTRKRAKVRLAHVVRAWAYSASWLVLFCLCGVMLLWLEVGLDIKDLLDAQLADPETRYARWFLALGIMQGGRSDTVSNFLGVWLMVYWWFAITRGWRIRGKDAISMIMSIVSCGYLGGTALMWWARAHV